MNVFPLIRPCLRHNSCEKDGGGNEGLLDIRSDTEAGESGRE